ncbi:hypothetical protein [Nonlabens agnitus]|uniref:Uncharacterized protein n=1 Tax=Nonlabens agnitus TaxID=870484 RepID=A0A2S9WT51_9FLAO|nr:hypothetical protein [Nonlabens agnitus]PRP66648.1 hypothetical protein BST86_05800 [Nonlabens agnitus]
MRTTAVLFTLLFWISPLWAQQDEVITDSTSIAFIAYWSIGDSYDYKISKVETNWQNNLEQSKDSTSYLANFKVVDSTATSYTIDWTHKKTLVEDSSFNFINALNDNDSVWNEIEKLNFNNVKYTTNELGVFTGIVNWKEISEGLKIIWDEIIRMLKEKYPNKFNMVESQLQQYLMAFTSKEGIEQFLVPELQYFHFPLGVQFETDVPIMYEDEVDHHLTNTKIKADATITFEEVDTKNGFCILRQESRLNPQDIGRVLEILLDKNNVPEHDRDGIDLKIFDNNYYQYFYNPGVPEYIYISRTSSSAYNDVSKQKLVEHYIELQYDDNGDPYISY